MKYIGRCFNCSACLREVATILEWVCKPSSDQLICCCAMEFSWQWPGMWAFNGILHNILWHPVSNYGLQSLRLKSPAQYINMQGFNLLHSCLTFYSCATDFYSHLLSKCSPSDRKGTLIDKAVGFCESKGSHLFYLCHLRSFCQRFTAEPSQCVLQLMSYLLYVLFYLFTDLCCCAFAMFYTVLFGCNKILLTYLLTNQKWSKKTIITDALWGSTEAFGLNSYPCFCLIVIVDIREIK